MANFNFNKTILGGRLTADPELKTTPNGVSVTSFSIAVTRKGTKDDPKTDFFNCVAWRGTAEFIQKYFTEGSSICVVGNLQTRTWEDNNGNKRYATEVIVEEASFVDSKSDAQTQNAFVASTEATTTDLEELGDEDPLPF